MYINYEHQIILMISNQISIGMYMHGEHSSHCQIVYGQDSTQLLLPA